MAGEIFSPVSSTPAFSRRPIRVSTSMRTTMVADTPPVSGSWSAGYRSMNSHNARPSASGVGFAPNPSLFPAPLVACWCLGAAIAASIFRNAAPWTVGRVKVPRVLPCPSSYMVR